MRFRWMKVLGGAGLLLTALVWILMSTEVLHAAKVHVGQPCNRADRPSLEHVDHVMLDHLLRRYVNDDGLVAYSKLKQSAPDMKTLDDYLVVLGCVDLNKPASKAAKLAFWINAYNAVTIKGILREYPTTSIRNHTGGLLRYNIWKDLLLWVDGKSYSLDDIEHNILRKMDEPRIHFAVVCASKGCPQLWNRAYSAAGIDEELSANARRFFARSENFRADPTKGAVAISQLLKWYGTDFAPTPQGQLKVLRRYFPVPESHAWMDAGRATVSYLEYDWGLNDQALPSR